MVNAATPQRLARDPSARARIRAALLRLGIKLEEPCWAWSTSYATAEHCRRFNWETFLRPLSVCLSSDPQLPNALRWLAACWVTGCGDEFLPISFATCCTRLRMMRPLLTDLIPRYGPLETITPRQCQDTVRKRYLTEEGHGCVDQRSLRVMLDSMQDLYRLRTYLPTGFAVEPFPLAFRESMIARGKRTDPWSAPPEPVCLELIRQAIRLLGTPADELIRVRDKYIVAVESAKAKGYRISAVRRHALRALQGERFTTLPGENRPWTDCNVEDTRAMRQLILALEGACALVLLFLSGPRVSEAQRAAPGCLRYVLHSNGIEYPYFVAERSKLSAARGETSDAHDTSHRGWILGPAGVRALQVLERISRPLRKRSRLKSYWLRAQGGSLWSCARRRLRIMVSAPSTLNGCLIAFSKLVQIAARTGWQGRLHSHMGRKACARFIAKRDRTALADLALQFGHLSVYITDRHYAQPDLEYQRLINEELAGEITNVAADLANLDIAHTFSNIGECETRALRERAANFVGQIRSAKDVRRMLGLGVKLIPCDWGMCVYRQPTSACGGDQNGPSFERRSPSICQKCLNFIATAKHRPFWKRRVDDCKAVLAMRDLPAQTIHLVELRLAEAQEVLNSIARDTR